MEEREREAATLLRITAAEMCLYAKKATVVGFQPGAFAVLRRESFISGRYIRVRGGIQIPP
jgi:hypothetical protein